MGSAWVLERGRPYLDKRFDPSWPSWPAGNGWERQPFVARMAARVDGVPFRKRQQQRTCFDSSPRSGSVIDRANGTSRAPVRAWIHSCGGVAWLLRVRKRSGAYTGDHVSRLAYGARVQSGLVRSGKRMVGGARGTGFTNNNQGALSTKGKAPPAVIS